MWMPFRMLDVLAFLAKVLTGTQAVWVGTKPEPKQKVYFANHTSNLDTIVIWSALPTKLRGITRPVAAKDYWDQPGIRRHIATKELNVVFVERNKETRTEDPLNPLRKALDEGYSLIIFPEGKRNKNVIPGEFKSGIYWLAKEYPHIDFIPVYLENVAKTFPRGALFPLPIICKAFFGFPMLKVEELPKEFTEKENIDLFLNTARDNVISLIPEYIAKAQPNYQEMVNAGKCSRKELVTELQKELTEILNSDSITKDTVSLEKEGVNK